MTDHIASLLLVPLLLLGACVPENADLAAEGSRAMQRDTTGTTAGATSLSFSIASAISASTT